jgi:hypothetical protein
MKKITLLSLFIALSAPLTAHALLTKDELLSYTAMPIAVTNVAEVQGVQTDQVGTLVTYMNQANVSPAAFIDVFRYVPVALVLNNGRNPDFVQWVGSEVNRGIVGDQLVTLMEQRLGSYGDVVPVTRTTTRRYYSPQAYQTVYEPDYVPVRVQRYSEQLMLDSFALIDMPVAVTEVVNVGVPVARVGGLVVQMNLAGVAPLQTVEVLRYSAPALIAVDSGGPDFVQYVVDQRVSGITGYQLVQVIDQRLPYYGITPQLDLAAPVIIGQSYVPSVVQNYVTPFDPVYVPQVVQTQVASAAVQSGVAVAPSPQVERLLEGQGGTVVVNPKQARREIARSMKAEKLTAPRVETPRVAKVHDEHPMHVSRPSMKVTRPQHVARPHVAPSHVSRPPKTTRPHGKPQFVPPAGGVAPQVQRGHGKGHVQSVSPQPQMIPAAPPSQKGNQGQGQGQGQGKKKGKGK